jgi:hypothetical protein
MDEPDGYCGCPLAGHCARHGVVKSTREWQLCRGRGEGLVPATPAKSAAYRREWDARSSEKPSPKKTAVAGGTPTVRVPRGRPGTELKALLAWFGQHASSGCGCSNHANEMDQRGCDWCEANIATIVKWLSDEAEKSKVLGFSLGIVPGFEIGAAALVRRAVGNARASVAKAITELSKRPEAVPFIREPLDRDELVKHLVFHMLPISDFGGWVWRRHVKHIRDVLPKFNGKVVVAVAGHPGDVQNIVRPFTKTRCTLRFDTIETVKLAFGSDVGRIEFIAVTNTTSGEGVSFPLLMGRVLSDAPNHVVCYGHTKGGTHPELPPSNPCHRWSEAMWATVANDHEAAIDALDDHAVAGSFLRIGHFHGGARCRFHFSGTFWWARCDEAFRKRWQKVPKHYGNVEMWPGNQWQVVDAACLFSDTKNGADGDLYSDRHWSQSVEPRLPPRGESLAAIQTATDKASTHSYLPVYDEWLAPYRERAINLVEIGVQFGHSLHLWSQAFPRATITGIDIDTSRVQWGIPDRATIHQRDVRNALDVLPEAIDVLIDDGSHTEADQLWVLEYLSDLISPGGVLIIEDIASEDIAQRLLAACPSGFAAEYRDLTASGRFDDRLIAFWHK